MDARQKLVEQLLSDKAFPARVIGLLVLFGIVMVATIVWFDGIRASPVGSIIEEAVGQIEEFGNIPVYLLPLLIFVNNVLVSLRVILTSITLVLPLVDVSFNAMVVGYVIADSVLAGNMDQLIPQSSIPQFIFGALTPHGSVEIPAIGIAASTVYYVLDKLRGSRIRLTRIALRNFLVTIYMLMAAAILEVTVSLLFAFIALIL